MLYLCFVDLENVFDTISKNVLKLAMGKKGVRVFLWS